MEKVQLILQLLHPYTFILTSTVIREMRVMTLLETIKVYSLQAWAHASSGALQLTHCLLTLGARLLLFCAKWL